MGHAKFLLHDDDFGRVARMCGSMACNSRERGGPIKWRKAAQNAEPEASTHAAMCDADRAGIGDRRP
jgi:hypothetical protein